MTESSRSSVAHPELSTPPLNRLLAHPELSTPPLNRLLESEFLLPLLFGLALFRVASNCVKAFLWRSFHGFKAYRLRNLSICLLHSTISGGWSLLFFITNPHVMLYDTLHWYRPWAAYLPIFSISYFLNDALDMAQHELSRWTIELFVHHAASIIAFLFSVLSHKFQPYNYWALLMEINSVFLHIRSIMQLCGQNQRRPFLYFLTKILNIITFLIFRFLVQVWQISWAYEHLDEFHVCYAFIALGGGSMFFIINVFLFYRILASDGFLGERLAKNAAINRDQQADMKSPPPLKKRARD